MVAKVINIILRFLGTIGLSSVICMSLSWITVGVLYLLLTLIPRFFSNLLGCPVLCSNFRVKKKLVLLLSL